MNATEKRYAAYVFAVREQIDQHIAGLDELSAKISQRPRIEPVLKEQKYRLIRDYAAAVSGELLQQGAASRA